MWTAGLNIDLRNKMVTPKRVIRARRGSVAYMHVLYGNEKVINIQYGIWAQGQTMLLKGLYKQKSLSSIQQQYRDNCLITFSKLQKIYLIQL